MPTMLYYPMKGCDNMMRILSVDDDSSVLQLNKTYLEKLGYDVSIAQTAEKTLLMLTQSSFDCILLDVRLDDADGFTLCRKIKENYSTPIIFLTNLGEEQQVLEGFSCGGDDYMIKPYRMAELEARIRARTHSGQRVLHYPPLTIDLDGRRAFVSGTPIPLTNSEFDILELLALHPNHAYSQQEIYEKLWNLPFLKQNNTIQVHIVQLRKKLDAACPQCSFVRTQWGKGYFFSPK